MMYIGESLEEIGFSKLLDLLMQRNGNKNIVEDYQDSYIKAQHSKGWILKTACQANYGGSYPSFMWESIRKMLRQKRKNN